MSIKHHIKKRISSKEMKAGEGLRRGNSMKLFKKRVRLDIAKYSFSNSLTGCVTSGENCRLQLQFVGQYHQLQYHPKA